MRLAVCRETYSDELFYGYIRWLAVGKGIERMSEMVHLIFDNKSDNAHVRVRYPTG